MSTFTSVSSIDKLGLWLAVCSTSAVAVLTFVWSRRCGVSGNRVMEGKTVLITGGSSGIGYATAETLASMGARVIFTGQSLINTPTAAMEIRLATGNDDVIGMTLDLGDFEDVRRFSREFLEKEERLDVLINNAAFLGPNQQAPCGLEKTFSVNHLGHFLLTELLLDLLQKSSPSRVVCITSSSYQESHIQFDDVTWLRDPMEIKDYNIYESYGRSKLANVLFVEALSRRYAESGVTSYAVHPGVVSTSLLRHWPGAWGLFLRGVSKAFFKTPERGAKAVVYCATEQGLEKHTGKYFIDRKAMEPCTKTGDADRLWKLSLDLCSDQDSDGCEVTPTE